MVVLGPATAAHPAEPDRKWPPSTLSQGQPGFGQAGSHIGRLPQRRNRTSGVVLQEQCVTELNMCHRQHRIEYHRMPSRLDRGVGISRDAMGARVMPGTSAQRAWRDPQERARGMPGARCTRSLVRAW